MNLIEILEAEHKLISFQLHYLEKKLKEQQEDALDGYGLKQMIFLMADTIQKHAKAEDQFLFPEMSKKLGKKYDFISMMNFEHGEILGILTTLEGTEDPNRIRIEAKRFIRTLRHHFLKEENSIFIIAKKKIGLSRLQVLANKARPKRITIAT